MPRRFDRSSHTRLGNVNIYVVTVCTFLFGLGIGAVVILGVPRWSGNESLSFEQEKARLEKEIRQFQLEGDVAKLRSELQDLQHTESANSNHQTYSTSANSYQRGTDSKPRHNSSHGQPTLAFWHEMNSVIRKEAIMRAVPTGGLTQINAAGFLNARLNAYEFAAHEISNLNQTGVDPIAVRVAMAVADWYGAGVQVTEQAQKVMNSPNPLKSGSFGMGWSADEKAHNASVEKLNSDGEKARQLLSQKYDMAFPPLE